MRLITCIAAVGICVSAAEEVRRKDLFSSAGLLSWSVLRYTHPMITFPAAQKVVDRLFSPKMFTYFLIAKLLTAASLGMFVLLYPDEFVISGVLSGLILTNLLLLKRRTTYGLDGSDHMNIVIFLGAAFFFLSPYSSVARTASILYIGLQAVLSYFMSGVAKVAGPDWREGKALPGIFSTKIYGHRQLGHFFHGHRIFSLFACWGIMVFQCFFAAVLVVNDELASTILFLGALFHFSTALFMGLNSFVFSFLATYPAIIWVRYMLLAYV